MDQRVLAVVFEFLEAGTPGERRACIAAHPELLEPPADAALAELAEKARAGGRLDIAVKLDECRRELARARVPPASPEAELLLAEFRALGPNADPRRQAELLKPLVRLIDPRVHGRLWAALQGGLGNALAHLSDQAGQGDYTEAIAAFEAAQTALARDTAPEQWLGNAHQLGKIFLRHRAGDPGHSLKMAIDYLTAALSPGAGRLPPPRWADAHAELADAYLRRIAGRRSENVELAIGHLEAAADVFTREDFPEQWADVRCKLGTAFRERIQGMRNDNLARAIAYFGEARNQETRDGSPLVYAAACDGLGTVYLDRASAIDDDIEKAIGCHQEALEIVSGQGLAEGLAAVQHNLGNAYLQRAAGKQADNIELALGCLTEALGVRTADRFPLDRAATQLSLGNAYLRRGQGERARNLELAIAAFRDADAAFARLRAVRQGAMAKHALAEAYANRVLGDRAGNVEQATVWLRAALTVFIAEGMVIEQAAARTGLGNALSEQTATVDSAISYHHAARETLGSSRTSPGLWADIHNNLGTAYLERHSAGLDDVSSAIGSFHEALAAGSAVRSQFQQAMTQHNLGLAYAERGRGGSVSDLRAAIGHLTAAREVFATTGSARHRRESGRALGDAFSRLGGHWQEALGAYLDALGAADDMYASSLLPDAREAELAEARGLHSGAAFAAAMTGDSRQAAELLERGRARGLGEAVARDAAELEDVGRRDGELAAAFLAAARELRDLEAADRPGGSLAAGREWDPWHQIEAARARLTQAVTAIRRLHGHGRFLVEPGFGEIAAAVSQAGPIAYLAVTDAGSLTLLITNGEDGVRAERVPEPDTPLTATALGAMLIKRDDAGAVTGGYLPVQMEADGSPVEFSVELRALLPVLGDRLIAPLAGQLAAGQASGVTLVACGLLGLLPLHAATYEADGEPRCLLDDYAVCYAPSARVLAIAHSRLAAAPAGAAVLAGVGDPAAGENPLPIARAELEEISARFATARVFYGGDATKRALLAAARGAAYVHLSCHGTFDPVTPGDSALLLAEAGRPDPLTLREVIALRPFATARLVVASACETAFTDFTELPDEAIGLPAGFLQGGTPGVIGTLWAVNAVSTALLITRFYDYHLGRGGQPAEGPMPPARALRLAQLWLARVTGGELAEYLSGHPALMAAGARVPRRERPYENPFYWAPFIIVGT